MMSRRKTLPSLSSSRQMMMAWKVSGLSHRPAIIASRPASMRLGTWPHKTHLGLWNNRRPVPCRQEKQEFETYARDCVKLAKQDNVPSELRNQLFKMACEWMHAAIDKQDGTDTPTPGVMLHSTIEPSGSAAQAQVHSRATCMRTHGMRRAP